MCAKFRNVTVSLQQTPLRCTAETGAQLTLVCWALPFRRLRLHGGQLSEPTETLQSQVIQCTPDICTCPANSIARRLAVPCSPPLRGAPSGVGRQDRPRAPQTERRQRSTCVGRSRSNWSREWVSLGHWRRAADTRTRTRAHRVRPGA